MNKYIFHRSDFHKWIIDEWAKASTPQVIYLKQGSFDTYIRLWRHECGKWYEVGDIIIR
jgi:hypothetical protein